MGFGVWMQWGAGRVPVGVNQDDSEFYPPDRTGGFKNHKLHEKEMGAKLLSVMPSLSGDKVYTFYTRELGDEVLPHSNLQPYITCYMWKRMV